MGVYGFIKSLASLMTGEGRQIWKDNFSVPKVILIFGLQLINFGFFFYGAIERPSK